MEFSYGESPLQIALGTLLEQVRDRIPTENEPLVPLPEVELSPDWTEFARKLFTYQTEYKKTMLESKRLKNRIDKLEKDMFELEQVSHMFQSTELEETYKKLVKDYLCNVNIDELRDKYRQMIAISLKMKKVLENTNAEQQTKFQCFVCMDRYVDTFLDPCGHLMCSTCWNRSQRVSCPACRQNARPKRVYTMN